MKSGTTAVETMWQTNLRDLPVVVRLLFSAALLTLGMGYLFALTNVALSVGMTQLDLLLPFYICPNTL